MKLNDVNRARAAARKMAEENAQLRHAVRSLNSEVKRLREQDARWQEMIGNLAKQAGESKRKEAHMRGMLRQVEWAVANCLCPLCFCHQDKGHADGCELAAALKD